MLNVIWPLFIIVSFAYAILTGNVENVNNSIFESAENTVSLCITLLGTLCLWNGIMEIATSTNLIKKLTRILKPVIKFLFPEIKRDSKAEEEISLNMITNILGLGNAATPIGLKAMRTMQDENKQKDTLSNSMVMFIVINTASLQLIPTTVIAIRTSLESNNPTEIIFPVWIATIIAAVTAITITKVLLKRK